MLHSTGIDSFHIFFARSAASICCCSFKCARCNVTMTPTYAYNHGLRYRYYSCSNHIRCKSCMSVFKTIPAEDVGQKVIDEVLGDTAITGNRHQCRENR
ncbi:MAG: zinc ribbon domain-containing protein [Holosporaceae bacterium]|nr:zinc ribbon domain-containing protein [Holosporaceae bacterium]